MKTKFLFDMNSFCDICHDSPLKWIVFLEECDFFTWMLSNTELWKVTP